MIFYENGYVKTVLISYSMFTNVCMHTHTHTHTHFDKICLPNRQITASVNKKHLKVLQNRQGEYCTSTCLTFARCALTGVWDKHGSINSIGDDGHLMWGDSRTQHCVLLAEKEAKWNKLFYPWWLLHSKQIQDLFSKMQLRLKHFQKFLAIWQQKRLRGWVIWLNKFVLILTL